ncbi:site-specific integrase [Lysinibacillus fusiformis]|nr:site-specific integrase [Lysinibacillus fusiformis]
MLEFKDQDSLIAILVFSIFMIKSNSLDDIKENKITVERQVKRTKIGNKPILTSLKNTSSYRTIAIEKDLLKELKKFKMKQNEMILSKTSFKKNEEDIIFQNYLGNYLTPSTVRESFEKYCEKANVEYKGTHVFRHTHAVLLLEAGASIKFVSNRLGHKTIKTTSDTYLDITEKIEEDELKKFASYIKNKI